MNAKNLIQMMCLLLVGFMTPATHQSTSAADPDWIYPDVELPTTQPDDFDYNLYWAFPRTCSYYVNYWIDGELDHSSQYDTQQQADDAAFFYNRVRVDAHATVEKKYDPYIWFFYGHYDRYDDTTQDKCFIQSLGFHTKITSVLELRRGNR